MASIAVIGTLDTKGAEIAFVRDEIAARGHRTILIDAGVLGSPAVPADITRAEVARAAGADLQSLAAANDRGSAVATMAHGVRAVVLDLRDRGSLDAVIGLGGGAGTSIATAAMRALPLGIPKVMVSTLASGDTRGFVGVSDITMMPAVVDVSGLNRISRGVFVRAAAAVCAMTDARVPDAATDKPLIAASMFGNTTQCVEAARAVLERAGFEVLVFHATGSGGQTMEHPIESWQDRRRARRHDDGWADEPGRRRNVRRSRPARRRGAVSTPAVVAPGCLDMVNFWALETVPEKYRDQRLYKLQRERDADADHAGRKRDAGPHHCGTVNARQPVRWPCTPLRGISVVSAEGGPFHWPEADAALFGALRSHLRSGIEVHELDTTINDPAFAHAMAQGLLDLVAAARPSARRA